MVITLRPELEAALTNVASRQGVAPEELALNAFASGFWAVRCHCSHKTSGSEGCVGWRRTAEYLYPTPPLEEKLYQ